MKVVITGGAGFLGSHLVDALIARGDEAVVIDHHVKEKHRFPNPKSKIHKVSFGDPSVKELLQSAVDAGVKKIVFASSGGAIYGDHPKRPTPLLEKAQPLSPYGVAKQSFEWYLEHFYQQHGLQYVSLRFSNLFGPRQQVAKPMGEGNVISLFLDRVLVTGEPLTIFGDGTSSRDFLYVDDAVDAILRSLDQPVTGIINVGTGKATTVNSLYEQVTELHGSAHPIKHEPYRKGEVLHSVIHPGSAKKLLNWKPKVSFKKGLKRTYAWYKQHFTK